MPFLSGYDRGNPASLRPSQIDASVRCSPSEACGSDQRTGSGRAPEDFTTKPAAPSR